MTNDNQKDPLSYWQSRALDAERERDELARDWDIEHYHRLAVQRSEQAMAARVERLRTLAKESQGWNWLSAWEEAQDAGAVNLLIPEMQELVDQVDTETPAQSLREVRAEAGRLGFVKGCLTFAAPTTTASAVEIAAHDYAQQIRSADQ